MTTTDRRSSHKTGVVPAVMLGTALVVAGFIAIIIGWHGAASNLFEAEQWPYVVSGGFGGLALIDVGITVLRTHHGRLMAAHQLHQLTLQRDAVAESVSSRFLSGNMQQSLDAQTDSHELTVALRRPSPRGAR